MIVKRRWPAYEVDLLFTLTDWRLPDHEIASRLGRTVAAVVNKRILVDLKRYGKEGKDAGQDRGSSMAAEQSDSDASE